MKILMEIEIPELESGDPSDWDHTEAFNLAESLVLGDLSVGLLNLLSAEFTG